MRNVRVPSLALLVLLWKPDRNEAWTGRHLQNRTLRTNHVSGHSTVSLDASQHVLQPAPDYWSQESGDKLPGHTETPAEQTTSIGDRTSRSNSRTVEEFHARVEEATSPSCTLAILEGNQVVVEDVSLECAQYHNSKRTLRLTSPLQALSAGLQERALKLIRRFVDNGCEPYDEVDTCAERGMNVYDTAGFPTCGAAVEAWYGELRKYTYERYSDWHHIATGHFTQALWNDSQQVGCYRTKGCTERGKQERLLCLYSPSGNVVGHYPFTIKQWKSLIEKEGLEVTTIVGPLYGPGAEQPETTTSTQAVGETPSTTSTTSRPSYTTTTTRTFTTTTSPHTTTTTATTTTTTTTTKRPTTTSTTTTTPPAVRDFTDDCLEAHNEKRVTGMATPIPALTRSLEAQAQAENYRDQIERTGCPFKHSAATRFGENLYKSSFAPTCADAVALWYAEKSKYTRYTAINNFNYTVFGHFTQVMWADTKGLGCAVSLRCRIVLCNYYPPGNYAGRYPFSVAQYQSLVAREW